MSSKNTDPDYMSLAIIALFCIFLVLAAIGYLVIAGLSYLICLGFGLAWSWLSALALYATIVLLGIVAKIIF